MDSDSNSINCKNHNDRRDSLKCTSTSMAVADADVADSHPRHRQMTKSPPLSSSPSPSPSTVKKRIDSAAAASKCRCCCNNTRTIRSRSQSEHFNKKRLYRTYSSFGFRNLNNNYSQSHWSLNEGSSKGWPDDRCNKKTTCEAKRYELVDFQRCMKLLGIDTSSQESIRVESLPNRKVPNTKKVKPKITTRITSSTISLEDIQDALTNDLERTNVSDPSNRSFLAQAVYERWYFNKMQERKRQRREAELKNEQMRREFEQMRCEQKLKAEMSYQEWMKKKTKSKNSPTKSDTANTSTSNRSSARRFIPKNSEDEYVKWRTAKNEQLEKKRHQWKEQKERENEEKQRKKIEAEKAYQAWKNKVNEDLKKKVESQRKREKENKEKANHDKMEKEREALTSFNAWKQNKLQQMKKTRNEQKLSPSVVFRFESTLKIEARTQRIAERLYEAEQAFYQWLESVDERISSAKS
ncbi:reticulocyte-binding protein homolog 2a-like isoform X1 [Planococcus citri]|uniref:reticulocyte-binding protein homolog 2a-like isoform X1 n=1 Tax=Planococcus citri TaxID=170843 RepID=UPI0031F947D5